MKTMQQMRFTWLSTTVLICSIISITAPASYAQRGKRTFRRAQFEQAIPSVDVPSPANEGSLMPSINDVIPPSLDGSSSRITPEIPMHEQQYGEQQPIVDQYQEPSVQPYHEQIQEPYPIDDYSGDQSLGYQNDGPAPVYSTGTWYRRGQWYSGFEVMFMTRTDARNVDIVAHSNNLRDQIEDVVTHNFRPGTRLTLGSFLGRDAAGRDHMIEGEFVGLFEWNDSRTYISENPLGVGGIQSLNAGIITEVFNAVRNADQQRFDADTDYNQFSLNYKVASRPGRDQLAMQPDGRWVRHGAVSQMRTLMAGLKYISFNDSLLNSAFLQGPTNGDVAVDFISGETGEQTLTGPVLDPRAVNGVYNVLTNNDMFGLHVGGEMVEKYDEWSWGLKGSVGGMANFAQRRSVARSTIQNTDTVTETPLSTNSDGQLLFLDGNNEVTTDPTRTVTDPMTMEMTVVDNTPVTDTIVTTTTTYDLGQLVANVQDEQLVFVADAGAFVTYQLRPNLHFKASYNFTYLTGLALAPENLTFINGFSQLNVNGSTLLHGGSVGFETTW